MGVISHDNIVYRDMPYKLAMHNTEGDTYFLYDELDNKSTMTPFVFDEEQIDNPDFLETLNELKDNFINGDIYQNDNYMNIITKNIEKIGDVELSVEERQFLKNTIFEWAKRSRYVQEFTSDFDKIGIDISNILYEEDPIYRDLKEDIQKSEERNLEKASKQINSSTDVIINETDTEQLKQDGINIQNNEIPNSQENEVSDNLDSIDPAMMEQVKEEKEITKEEQPQKVVEVIRTEKLEETTDKELENNQKAQEENVVEQDPMNKQIPDEVKPAVGASNEATSGQYEPVSSVLNENGARIIVDSKYILKKENDYDNNPVMYDCWKKITYLDVDRSITNSQELISSIETTIDRAVTPEDYELIQENLKSWILAGGVAAEMQETLQKYIQLAHNKSENSNKNLQEGFVRRDVLNTIDYIKNQSSKKENTSVDLSTSKYLSMMDVLDSHPINVSDEKIEDFRRLLNGQRDLLVKYNNALINLQDDNQVMFLFHRKQAMIDDIIYEWSKGNNIKQSDIDKVQLLMDQLEVIMENAPANFNSYYKDMYNEYIANKKEYINSVLNPVNSVVADFKMSYDKLREYMSGFEGRMSMNDVMMAQEFLNNVKTKFEQSVGELTEEEINNYKQNLDSYSLYINGQSMMLEDEESVTVKM